MARAYIFNALDVATISDSINAPYPNNVVITKWDKYISATDEGIEKKIVSKIALYCTKFCFLICTRLIFFAKSGKSAVPIAIPIIPKGNCAILSE